MSDTDTLTCTDCTPDERVISLLGNSSRNAEELIGIRIDNLEGRKLTKIEYFVDGQMYEITGGNLLKRYSGLIRMHDMYNVIISSANFIFTK